MTTKELLIFLPKTMNTHASSSTCCSLAAALVIQNSYGAIWGTDFLYNEFIY